MAEYDIQGNPNVDEDYLRQEQDADNAMTCPSCGCNQAYYWPWKEAGWCPICKEIFDFYGEESMAVGNINYDAHPIDWGQERAWLEQEEDWRSILDEEQENIVTTNKCHDCLEGSDMPECPLSEEEQRECQVRGELRGMFPYGHERFIELSLKEMSLHSRKNYDYTNKGNSLGNFDRVSAILAIYGYDIPPALVALIYSLKQQDAVMWQIANDYEGDVEGVDKKAEDVHVYWKLFRILFGRKKKE